MKNSETGAWLHRFLERGEGGRWIKQMSLLVFLIVGPETKACEV